MYIHVSDKEVDITKFKPIYKNQFNKNPIFYNPGGLWYSCDMTWADHSDSHYKYMYSVDTSNLNICKISTISELDDFNKRYYNSERENLAQIIDWDKVYKEYDGLEICPYLGYKTKYSKLFQYIHHHVSFDGKTNLAEAIKIFWKNGELTEKEWKKIPFKIRDEMRLILKDFPKYLNRIWCIGWELGSGVIWKNYKKVKSTLIHD
jgi:hypothetical protein